MEYEIWNMCENWRDEASDSIHRVGTVAAADLIEACKLAPALFPAVEYFRVTGPVQGEIFTVEFPASERQNFDDLRAILPS